MSEIIYKLKNDTDMQYKNPHNDTCKKWDEIINILEGLNNSFDSIKKIAEDMIDCLEKCIDIIDEK